LVCIVDEKNTILYANQMIVDVFGNVIGRKCWKVLCEAKNETCEDCINSMQYEIDMTISPKSTDFIIDDVLKDGNLYSFTPTGYSLKRGKKVRIIEGCKL
jgi:hypothetical protein